MQIGLYVQSPPVLPEASTTIWFAIGDDDSAGTFMMQLDQRMRQSKSPVVNCVGGFTCYSEDQLKTNRIDVDFTSKKTRRLFFAIGNTSETTISQYNVSFNLSADSVSDLHGMSLVAVEGQKISQTAVEFQQNSVLDILPYSRTHTLTGFSVDLTVEDNLTSNVTVVVRMFAPNLTLVEVPVFLHIVKRSS